MIQYLDRNLTKNLIQIRNDSHYSLKTTVHRVFGFLCNPDKNKWTNKARIVGDMSPHEYFTRPSNMAFHNLCTTAKTPPGIANLLGLGLKYCIEPPKPYQDLDDSIRKLQRSVRLHFSFANEDSEENEETKNDDDDPATTCYIPKLYIPSTWQPGAAKDDVEAAFSTFDRKINELKRRLPKTRRYNLSQPQRNVLSELATRKDLIIFPTDKNLGPSVAERDDYIHDVLTEHLLNHANYEFLPKAVARLELQKQRRRFLALYAKRQESLISEAEQTYFHRATKVEHLNQTRVPQFYGTYKVHKEGRRSRPVVSSVNSTPEIFSKWVDYWLKKVVGSILPTYIRDAKHLIWELHTTFPNGLPKTAKLFSVNAVALYSNIDTDHGIEVLKSWLRLYRDELPPSMPVDFVVEALEEIMKNNIFQFGDTYWKQKRGCAMGTSAAMNYAYLYVGLLEVKRLLPNYKNNLLFFK